MSNKKICSDCGTEYSASEARCPLCGSSLWESAAPAANPFPVDEFAAPAPAPVAPAPAEPAPADSAPRRRSRAKEKKPTREVDDGMPKSLVVASTVLVFIAVVALGWHILAQWIPGLPTFGSTDESAPPSMSTEGPAPTDPEQTEAPVDLSCTDITIDSKELSFNEAGQAALLSYSLSPEGCTDPVSFTAEDPAVATVDEAGKVTAVANGTTAITIKCGIVSKQVSVTVRTNAPLPLKVSESEVTFSELGQQTTVSISNAPADAYVVWESDDETVATVDQSGLITAVGDGSCVIKVRVDAQTLYVNVKVSRAGIRTGRADGNVRIRSEASTSGEQLCVMVEGDKVTILGEEGEWYQVQYDDNGTIIEGYAHKDYIIED